MSITLLSQIVYGGIAYWITADSEQEAQLDTASDTIETAAHEFTLQAAAGELSSRALEYSRKRYSPNTDLMLVSVGRDTLYTAGPLADAIDLSKVRENIVRGLKGADAGLHHGKMEIHGEPYLWVSTPLMYQPGNMISLQRVSYPYQLWSVLSSRFFAAGLVVLWCSVWVALLLVSIIGKKLQEKREALRHQGFHDGLTGLPNRALLHEWLSDLVAQSEKTDHECSLLVMGIGRFKEINDTLGHSFGDQVLLEVGARIRDSLFDGQRLARVGGDEFAVLLVNSCQDDAEKCAKSILSAMEEPVYVRGLSLKLNISIGIAVYPIHTADIDSIVRYADVAMYQARQAAQRIAVYDDKTDCFSMQRLKLGAELHEAIEKGQMVLHLQPKIMIKTGRVCGFEALVRWQHHELGLIPPGEFIAIAEQTGAIIPLTIRVMDDALGFLARTHGSLPELSVAINISCQCLRSPRFENIVFDMLAHHGLPAHALTLEITESVLMDDVGYATRILGTLHDYGVQISVDDFGTGFSSLAYLRQLPVDELKVDREFVREMQQNPGDQAIVRSINDLAHNLGHKVVAEGVEDEATLALLGNLGCDIAQGYFISKPQSEDEILGWLQSHLSDGAEYSPGQSSSYSGFMAVVGDS